MRERRMAEADIMLRVQRHWGRMRSFGKPFRQAMIHRDINAARVRAGMEPHPLVQLGQLPARARIHRVNFGPRWLDKVHPRFREAWLAHLAAGGEGLDGTSAGRPLTPTLSPTGRGGEGGEGFDP